MDYLVEAAKKEYQQNTGRVEKRDVENKYSKFQQREEFVKGIEETHKFKKLKLKK